MHEEVISNRRSCLLAAEKPVRMCEISIPAWSGYSRLSGGGVLGQSDGEGGVAELRRPRSSHHREHGGNAAAAQLVRSHDRQQVFPVLLQGEARRPHLTVLPVHLETAVAACKEYEVHYDVGARFTKERGVNAPLPFDNDIKVYIFVARQDNSQLFSGKIKGERAS